MGVSNYVVISRVKKRPVHCGGGLKLAVEILASEDTVAK